MTSSYDSFPQSHFETFDVKVSDDITIHGVQSIPKSQDRPAVLLIHGHPQTHHIWHKVAPHLAERFNVVAPDLRGHGESSKPAPAEDTTHETYSKRSMAKDQVAVMKALGYEKFYVVGHDRGGRVAHRLALDYPELVIKVVLLDIAPTLTMYEQANQTLGTSYWHWFFLIQAAPMPEDFLNAFPGTYLARFGLFAGNPSLTPAALASYSRNLHDPASVHAMCEDYRASAPGKTDLVLDAKDLAEGHKVKAPIHVLWGAKGVIPKVVADPIKEWRVVSDAEVTGRPVDSGHYIPEDMNTQELLKEIVEFFGV